jgi:hypothetical protein
VRHLERIGQKDEWLVFFELPEQVADHCRLTDGSTWEEVEYRSFDGRGDPYVRDIDPSILIRDIPTGRAGTGAL